MLSAQASKAESSRSIARRQKSSSRPGAKGDVPAHNDVKSDFKDKVTSWCGLVSTLETWLEVACNECAYGGGEDDMQDGPDAGGGGHGHGPALLAKAWKALNAAAAAFDLVKPPQKDMKESVEGAGGRVFALACAVLQGEEEPSPRRRRSPLSHPPSLLSTQAPHCLTSKTVCGAGSSGAGRSTTMRG